MEAFPSTYHQLLRYRALVEIYKRRNIREGKEDGEST